MPGRLRLALIFAGVLCAAQQAEGPRILRPADSSVVEAGPISVIAKTAGQAELKLDGKPVSVSKPADNVLMATVDPGEGPHEILLVTDGREYKSRIHVGGSAPDGWPKYRSHPPGAECSTCHSAANGSWTLKEEVAGPICMTCHDAAAFPKSHTHKPVELEECQICHNPHGSAVSRHLILPKQIACKQCHG